MQVAYNIRKALHLHVKYQKRFTVACKISEMLYIYSEITSSKSFSYDKCRDICPSE